MVTTLPAETLLYRVQDRAHRSPLLFGCDPQVMNRWNPCASCKRQYGVLYAALNAATAIAETLLHDDLGGVIDSSVIDNRTLWTIEVPEDLMVVNLGGPALHAIRQDMSLLSTPDLRYPKAWSCALHCAYEKDLQGLVYPARALPGSDAAAIFDNEGPEFWKMWEKLLDGVPQSQPLRDWVCPKTGRNIIDWLEQECGILVYSA